MAHSANPGFKSGLHWVCCDRCGFDYYHTEVREEWNGLVVCGECYEPRHPQDFVRGKADKIVGDWPRRPCPPVVSVAATYKEDLITITAGESSSGGGFSDTFDSDVSLWTETAATVAWDAGGGDGQMEVSTFFTPAEADRSFTTVSGGTHSVSVNVRAFTTGSNDRVDIWIGSTQGAKDLLDETGRSSTGTYSSSFVATGTTSWIRIRGYDNLSDAGGVQVDDIVIGAASISTPSTITGLDFHHERIPRASFSVPGTELITDPNLGVLNGWAEIGSDGVYDFTIGGQITVSDSGAGANEAINGGIATGSAGALAVLKDGSTYDVRVTLGSISISSGTLVFDSDIGDAVAITLSSGSTNLVYRNAVWTYNDTGGLGRDGVFRMVTSSLDGIVVVEHISVREVGSL